MKGIKTPTQHKLAVKLVLKDNFLLHYIVSLNNLTHHLSNQPLNFDGIGRSTKTINIKNSIYSDVSELDVTSNLKHIV